MVKRKFTDEEELIDLARRASELSLARNKATIKKVMELNPCAADLVLRTLRSHGYDLNCINEAAIAHPPASAAKSRSKVAQETRLANVKSQTHAAAIEEMKAADNQDWVPTKYWKIDSLSVVLMMTEILSKLEPHALSAPNLRNLNKRGNATTSKANLVELIEYVTGQPGDYLLVGPLRHWLYLLAVLKFNCGQRGRRGKDMTFPVDYAGNDSIYHKRTYADNNFLKNRFTQEEKVVPATDAPKFSHEDDLYFTSCFSESRCMLKSYTAPCAPWCVMHHSTPKCHCRCQHHDATA